MDLKQHLIRQMAFSHATYGPGVRTAGVIDHIRKELVEVQTSNGESDEWVDVVILALDGLTRRLAYCTGVRGDPEFVADLACRLILAKQARNEARTWPDWRTADSEKAIEHDRSSEKTRPLPGQLT
ncbi:dATP/dGTP pyrophosphohydrolase domain-containing protein [Oceanicola sp. S124]|uniref:dATP/dGTP pyrophosphohydrolase domain-containing protein n=1 Tax=Oceanicola sp. S124 TaxID=1042378 RepID=UPI0002559C7E|nr:dATP/dGTP pyrophosphohydrolase domain-containing protein [Oceanicola sp. S124]